MSIFNRIYHSVSGGPPVLCPYCFHKFKLQDKTQDQPICPKCSRVIPINAVDYHHGLRPRVFGLLGAKAAGKTLFIGSMLESIRRMGIQFNWALTGLGDAIERYRTEFYEPIFVDHRPPPLSHKGVGKKPLSFKLTVQTPNGRLNVIFLTFFDGAGESFAKEELIESEVDYICNADGLILLLDPLQLPGVRRALEGKVELPNRELDTEDIVQRTANVIRRRKKVLAQQKIKTSMAVTFSKLDALLDLCPPESPLRYQSKHAGFFSRSDFEDIDAEIRGHLHDWECPSLINQVRHNFSASGFFGISALGCSPDRSGSIPQISPMRVLDPLIWQLGQHGLLRKEK